MAIDVNCKAWEGFHTGEWRHLVNVRNFIQKNYTPYEGDESFLEGISKKTEKVWGKAHDLIVEEIQKGIIDVETKKVSGINNFAPGYLDKDNEVIVGFQTDAPLKRIVNLYGGMRMATSALKEYGYELDPEIESHFKMYRKTHNEGVFDAYPKRTRLARTAGLADRFAGCIWPRKNCGGLSKSPALWNRFSDRGEGKRSGHAGRTDDGRTDSVERRGADANPCFKRNGTDGRKLWL